MKLRFAILMILAMMAGCSTQKKEIAPEPEYFTISRTFNTDAKALFEMWIKPDQYVKWLGPAGANMKFIKADVREGGTSLWSMRTPDGKTKHGQIHYKTFTPNSLVIYTQNFSDEKGTPSKPFFSETYPDSLLMTATMQEEAPDKTLMTVKWEIDGEATDVERKTFQDMKPAMKMGWGQSFDKLETLIKK